MCLFTSARTAAIVFARSAGSEAMYCAGVLTFDGGFMDSSSSRTSNLWAAALPSLYSRTAGPGFDNASKLFRPLLRSFPRIEPDQRRNRKQRDWEPPRRSIAGRNIRQEIKHGKLIRDNNALIVATSIGSRIKVEGKELS